MKHSTEKKQRDQEKREERKTNYSKQVIKFAPGWKLMRLDAQNWAIVHENRSWFYGRLLHAIQDIPHKLLNEGDKKCLVDVREQLEQIAKVIDRLDLHLLRELQNGVETRI